MIMLGLYRTGQVPFKTIYLHGLVLDAKGQKMSKSKGNVINPLDFTAKYGTDAFRMGLVIGNTPGTSLALSEDKVSAYKKFANKIWNITRFVLESTEGSSLEVSFRDYSEIDNKLITERNLLIKEITGEMNDYKFYIVAEKLYHYIWHRFADLILEESKVILKEGSEEDKKSRKQFLLQTLDIILKTLHPFMPFITEEIWQIIHKNQSLLMVEKWPQS